MELTHLFITFAFIPIFAIVWCNILIDRGGVFSRFRTWIDQFPLWLFKILGGCAPCFSGQLALWTFPLGVYYLDIQYFLFYHFASVVITIFVTDRIDKSYYL